MILLTKSISNNFLFITLNIINKMEQKIEEWNQKREQLKRLEKEMEMTEELKLFIDFCKSSEKGIVR